MGVLQDVGICFLVAMVVLAGRTEPARFTKGAPSMGNAWSGSARPRSLAGPEYKGHFRWRVRTWEGPLAVDSSLLVLGPTRSGKTTSVVLPAVSGFDGMVICTSIKQDVVNATAEARSKVGRIYVIGCANSYTPWIWDPCSEAINAECAMRLAHLVMTSAPGYQGASADSRFWFHAAEPIIGALLRAGFSNGGIEAVAQMTSLEGLVHLCRNLDELGEERLASPLYGLLAKEERHISSVLVTVDGALAPFVRAVTALSRESEAWESTRVADFIAQASPTLYICAPFVTQVGLAPYFSALIQYLILEMLTDRDYRALVVLDEAANIAPLANLAEIASISAGYGLRLITVFQDLSQVESVYGTRSGTVVNNHPAKLFLPGISDPKTMDLCERLAEGVNFDKGRKKGSIRELRSGRAIYISRNRPARLVALHKGKWIKARLVKIKFLTSN